MVIIWMFCDKLIQISLGTIVPHDTLILEAETLGVRWHAQKHGVRSFKRLQVYDSIHHHYKWFSFKPNPL